MTSAAPRARGAVTAVDLEAGGIETELGWSLQATYQGGSRGRPLPPRPPSPGAARVALREVGRWLMRGLEPEEQTQLRHLLARVALGAGVAEACTTTSPETTDERPVVATPTSARRLPSAPSES